MATKTGIVVSTKMDKTIVVLQRKPYAHPVYGKTLKTSKRFMTHDEFNECNLGDQLPFLARPIGRDKCWKVKQILKKTLLSN